MKAGTQIISGDCLFSVWAPEKEKMLLHIIHPFDKTLPLKKDGDGYFTEIVKGIGHGCRYFYQPDGKKDLPDPASNHQPEGVKGPSEVVDHGLFKWNDNSWKGLPLKDLILYELHVGTFTPQGTFEAIISRLDELKDTGINSIELMPVAQFPGSRNWGYDGVFPYAVQNTYGGPDGLKSLVDAAHQKGLAVFLDVVYNHLGPEGNYFGEFGPYFTGKYKVPWGDAINLDDRWSDGVRDFFSYNACHWLENYHIDGLRLDAIHTIFDFGAVNFWELLNKRVRRLEQENGRRYYLLAESDLNSPRVLKDPENGGYGFDGVWLDDFHHTLYVLLHPEGRDRYEDYGKIEHLAKCYSEGFVHTGEFVKFRKKKYGASSSGIPGERFVAFNQNHDQIGNRVLGERLNMLTGLKQLKMAAAALLLSPYIPLLFMGEEYGDVNPFFYFVDHSDPDLIKAVREGRKKEFADYKWAVDPPDPQDEATFLKSKINFNNRNSGKHKILLKWYRELIAIRKGRQALANTNKDSLFVYVSGQAGFAFTRSDDDRKDHVLCLLNFSGKKTQFIIPPQTGVWTKILDSAEEDWRDSGEKGIPSPFELRAGEHLNLDAWSVVVYGNK